MELARGRRFSVQSRWRMHTDKQIQIWSRSTRWAQGSQIKIFHSGISVHPVNAKQHKYHKGGYSSLVKVLSSIQILQHNMPSPDEFGASATFSRSTGLGRLLPLLEQLNFALLPIIANLQDHKQYRISYTSQKCHPEWQVLASMQLKRLLYQKSKDPAEHLYASRILWH